MKDPAPRPWLLGDAPPELARLLDSARLDDPSPAQLNAVAARLGPLLLAPVAVGAAAAQSQVGALAAKGAGVAGQAGTGAGAAGMAVGAAKTGVLLKVLTVTGAAVAVGGAFQAGRIYEEKAGAPRMVERPVVLVPPPAPVAPEPASPPAAAEPESAPIPAAPAPAPHVSARPVPLKAEAEAAILDRAMGALKAGDAERALELCRQHAQKAGAQALLSQEREVIAIEALVRLGRTAEARKRAEKFRAEFPTSTHLLKVERLVGP